MLYRKAKTKAESGESFAVSSSLSHLSSSVTKDVGVVVPYEAGTGIRGTGRSEVGVGRAVQQALEMTQLSSHQSPTSATPVTPPRRSRQRDHKCEATLDGPEQLCL